MFKEWRARGMFASIESSVCDQARAVRKNGWLSERELEALKRQVEGELCREQDVPDDAETLETDVGPVEAEVNDAEDSIGDTEGDLSKQHQAIVKKLRKVMVKGRTSDGIMFKKVDKKVSEVQTDRVNEAIKYLKSKSITKTNNLIRAASAWLAEQMRLKKAKHRKKNEPRWKCRIEGDLKRLRQEVNLLGRLAFKVIGLRTLAIYMNVLLFRRTRS